MDAEVLNYSLPHQGAKHVDFVQPMIKFPAMKPLRSLIHSLHASKLETEDHQLSLCTARTPDSGKLLNLTTPGACNGEFVIGKNPGAERC